MAEKDVAIKISIDNENAGKSLKDLKQEFKELNSQLEGLDTNSKEYIKTLKQLGNTRDEIQKLNESINAFAGGGGQIKAFGNVVSGLAGGFSAAQGAAAMFGLEGEDLQKTMVKLQAVMAFQQGIQGLEGLGDAFKVLGNIIRTNPLLMVVTVVAAIGTALFALKDKIGVVGDAFDWLSEMIGKAVQAVKDFTDWIGLSSFAFDEYADNLVAKTQQIQKATTERYDKEIKLAQAAGKETTEIEIEKQKAIIQTAKLEAELLAARIKQQGEYEDGQKERLSELIKTIDAASTEIQAIVLKREKAEQDKIEETTRKNKEELKKREEDHKKHLEEIQKLIDESYISAEERRQAAAVKEIEDFDKNTQAQLNELDALFNSFEEKKVEKSKQLSDVQIEQIHSEIDAWQQLATAQMALSDMVFSHQIKQAQGNEQKEKEIRKRQFKVNKAFGVVTATIDGIQAVQKALNNPYPLNLILAAASGIAAAANVAKIASQQFNEGGASSAGFSADSGTAVNAPSIAPPTQGGTQLNADGTIKKPESPNIPEQKVYVVETDITKTQKRVSTIEQGAKV